MVPLIVELIFQFAPLASDFSATQDFDFFCYLLGGVAMSWALVWILAPWICRGSQRGIAAKQFVLMLFGGTILYIGYFGFFSPLDALLDTSTQSTKCVLAGMFLLTWAPLALALALNSFFTGLWRPRHKKEQADSLTEEPADEIKFRPFLRFLFAAPLTGFLGACVFVSLVCLVNWGLTWEAVTEFPSGVAVLSIPATIAVSVLVFVLNFPIFLLGRRRPEIRERWFASFGGVERPQGRPLPSIVKRTMIGLLLLGVLAGISFGGIYTYLYVKYAVRDEGTLISWNLPDQEEVPDEENAAVHYLQIPEIFPGNIYESVYNNEDYEAILRYAFLNDSESESPDELLKPVEEDVLAIMRKLRVGSNGSRWNWRTQEEIGIGGSNVSRGYLSPVVPIGFCRVLQLADARQYDEAIATWSDVMVLVRRLTYTSKPTSFFTPLGHEASGYQVAARFAPLLDDRQRQKLRDAFEELPPRKTLKEIRPVYYEHFLDWAKDNPVRLTQGLDQMRTLNSTAFGREPGGWGRIQIGKKVAQIDWDQVEELLQDRETLLDSLTSEQWEENATESLEKLRSGQSNLEWQIAFLTSVRGHGRQLSLLEQSAENGRRMFAVGLEILDGKDPAAVLKDEAYLDCESAAPFLHTAEEDGFAIQDPSVPTIPDSGESYSLPYPQVSGVLRFGR